MVSYAKSKGFDFIVMDAGETPSSDLYSLADLVITYETYYSSFSLSDLVISTSSPASQQGVILTQAPTADSYSTIVLQLASADVGAVYITNLADSVSGVPQEWPSFVIDVASVTSELDVYLRCDLRFNNAASNICCAAQAVDLTLQSDELIFRFFNNF
ncbi:hypothetical protein H0H92_013906 [Tricholoma furcatifolium]|nr:hypothetical protein H0H92_013906 [Tricholoma furcatifolium]